MSKKAILFNKILLNHLSKFHLFKLIEYIFIFSSLTGFHYIFLCIKII